MKLFLLSMLCICGLSAAAQTITISARVLDKTSDEPLPFATVGLKGRTISTVTNLQGDFDFHIPREYQNDILVISMLGYKNFEAPVWSLLNQKTNVIHVERSTTVLAEIVIADSLGPAEIVNLAIARIEDNYPREPYLLDAFYRDVKKVGGTYIALLEAAVQVYDENYAPPRNKAKLRERVRLLEVRKSIGYDNKFAIYFDQNNLLEELLLHNNIRYRQFDTSNRFLETLKREHNTFYNDHEVYVVSGTDAFNFRMFIDKVDFAIIRLEYESKVAADYLGRKRGLVSKAIAYRKAIEFKRHEGKMFLNYMTVTTSEDWHDVKTNNLKFQTQLVQSLMVNAVYPNTTKRVGATERMKNYGLQYQDYPYNKDFWNNYNVIKETPIDIAIRADLEKLLPLEKQFEDNY